MAMQVACMSLCISFFSLLFSLLLLLSLSQFLIWPMPTKTTPTSSPSTFIPLLHSIVNTTVAFAFAFGAISFLQKTSIWGRRLLGEATSYLGKKLTRLRKQSPINSECIPSHYSPLTPPLPWLLTPLFLCFSPPSSSSSPIITPTSLFLKRSFPNRGMNLTDMRKLDMGRHERMIQSHVLNFPLHGTSNLFRAGLYYTTVCLGSPPREFHVDIDTGSDVLWVNCVPCDGCPQTSELPFKPNYFDPRSSSTSSIISCLDKKCRSIEHSRKTVCTIDNKCSFKLDYVEGSITSGYFLSDVMHVGTIAEGSVAPNSSLPLLFGCSNLRSGKLTLPIRAIDGIFGFGKSDISFISQLHSEGVAPKVFSHCLKGDISGGGILVLGEALDPDMIYSPLIPKQRFYNLKLESITVNGQMLQVDPEVFKTSSRKGAIVDSGTTLAFFNEGVYNPLVDAITRTIPPSVGTTDSDGYHCYLVTNSELSIINIFPLVSLNFANQASMVLRPEDYLLPLPMLGGEKWCIGFQKAQDQTILGDIILKDKIIVYDLAKQRIGWTYHNCSLPFNVSTRSSGKSITEKGGTLHLTMIVVLVFFMHLI